MSVSTQPGQIALTWTPSRRELGGERAHEPEQPRLGGAVARVRRDGDPREDRGEDDDVPRVRPRREVPERRAHAVVRAVEVRRDEVVEAVAALVVLAVRPAEPAAGDERVDRAERAARRARTPASTRRALADVARARRATAPSIARGRLARDAPRPRASSVSEAPSRAEPKGDRAPDPRARPRHHDVLAGHPSPLVRNLRGFRRRIPLQGRARHSVDCRCAEHGTRLGRSSPGRPYAEAEGQPGKWTKAHPARRILGPVYVEHTRLNASMCGL